MVTRRPDPVSVAPTLTSSRFGVTRKPPIDCRIFGYPCCMDRKAIGERMKLYVGITGIPVASAEDVMGEARLPACRSYRSKDRVDRVARRARLRWVRLLIGVGLLCPASQALWGDRQK